VVVISPQAYVFVEERHFMEPVRRSTVVVNNTTIINQTVINEGPATTVIEKASGRKVEAVPVQELRHKQEAAVVSKQRTPTATSEKTFEPPVRNEAQPGEKKAVPTHESAQVEKPAAATHESVAPASKNNQAQSEKQKPVPAAAESKPAAQPEARPEGNPPAIKEPTRQNADKQSGKQEKASQPPDKKEQQPARENPAATGKNGADPADKDHGNKPNE
jgi:hypothetical protein